MKLTRYFVPLCVAAVGIGSVTTAAPFSSAAATTTTTSFLSRVIGPPGAAVVVHGTSCAANAAVRVSFDGQLAGTGMTDASRTYRTTVHIPTDASPGTHRIWVNTPSCAGWTGGPFVVHTAVTSPGFDARNDGYDPFSSVPAAQALTNLGSTGKQLPSVDMETVRTAWTGGPFYPDYALVVADGTRLRTFVNMAPTMDPSSIEPTGVNCVEPHGRTFRQLLGTDEATGAVVASVANGIDAFRVGPNGCSLLWSRAGLSCTCRTAISCGCQQESDQAGFLFTDTDPNAIPNVQSTPTWQSFVLTSPLASPHTVLAISTTAGKQLWRTTIKGTLTSAAIIYPQPQLVLGTSTGQIYFLSAKTGAVTASFTGWKGSSVTSLLTTSSGQALGSYYDRGLVAFTSKGVENSVSLTAPVGDPVSNGASVYAVDGDNNVDAFTVSGKGLSGPVWSVKLGSPATGRPLLTQGWLGVPTTAGITFLDPESGATTADFAWVGTPFPVSIVALDGALLAGSKADAQWLVPLQPLTH